MAPVRSPRADLLVLLAMVLPTAATAVYFVALAESPWARPVYLGSKALQATLPLLWLVLVHGGRPAWGEPGRNGRRALLGLASGTLMGGAALLVFGLGLAGSPLAQAAAARIDQTLSVFRLDQPAAYLAFALGLAAGHSLFEEYYWRWFVFGRLRAHLGPGLAGLVASLAFASHHYLVVARFVPPEQRGFVAVLATLAVALGGWLWCGLYLRTGSLLAPWLSHALVDAALMAIGYRLAFG